MTPQLRACLLAAGLLGCATGPSGEASGSGAPEAGARPQPPPASGGDRPPLVAFLGNSLTAGFTLGEEEAWPALVALELERTGLAVRVINAGVNGDTSGEGLARLDWLLRMEPDVVVVELGVNDALYGLDLAGTERNLRELVRRARQARARVLLVGMQLFFAGEDSAYAERFAGLHPALAAELEVPLVPFLLEGVAGRPGLNLPDGLHPNAAGHVLLARNVLPHLRPLLESLPSSRR